MEIPLCFLADDYVAHEEASFLLLFDRHSLPETQNSAIMVLNPMKLTY
jgi:hypothetical protein